MAKHQYLVALGSNERHPRFGSPRYVLAAAIEALGHDGSKICSASPIIESEPIGPSNRRYANGAVVVDSFLDPEPFLSRLHEIEHEFGRRRRGMRWRSRVLDLDIILWSGGTYAGETTDLCIPHPAFRERGFVLTPANAIAGDWRDPITRLNIKHIQRRLTKSRTLPR